MQIEYPSIQELKMIDHKSYRQVLNYIISFAIFCFLANLIREIVKDIEDVEGDQKAGLKTLPIVSGIAFTKNLVIILTIALSILILIWAVFYSPGLTTSMMIALLLLLLPLLYILYKTLMATEAPDFHSLSNLLKIYFIIGLSSLILITT